MPVYELIVVVLITQVLNGLHGVLKINEKGSVDVEMIVKVDLLILDHLEVVKMVIENMVVV